MASRLASVPEAIERLRAVDYLADAPCLCHEVVPRLERLGLRRGSTALTTV